MVSGLRGCLISLGAGFSEVSPAGADGGRGGDRPGPSGLGRSARVWPDIGCLGRHLMALIRPWEREGWAVAADSQTLRVRGGVWPQKDRKAGRVPPTSIDTEAHGNQSGGHGRRSHFFERAVNLTGNVSVRWV